MTGRIPTALAGLLLASALASPSAMSQATEHAQAHEHAAAGQSSAVAQLQLDAGKRWPTDASLRDGMAQIRKEFDAFHPVIHKGKTTNVEYAALADRIGAQVDRIVANCKL